MNNTHSFAGNWITTETLAALAPIDVFHRQLDDVVIPPSACQNSHVLFRKKFYCESTENTTIYISADDYYKLYINGAFVQQGPAPAYTSNYNYNVLDISSYLKKGENTIAVHTYYQGLINRVWVSGDQHHGLILDIVTDDAVILSSDATFLCQLHSGYTSDKISGLQTQFMENYDANAPEVGFAQEDFDDTAWAQACLKQHLPYTLKEQESKMLVFDEIKPVQVSKTSFGYLIDFGKNYVGYLNFAAKGRQFDTIRILCGQEFDQDNRVRYQLRANCTYDETMTLSGKEDLLNQFDYKAFRYVELITPDDCEITNLSLTARHYPFTLSCEINTTDPDLQKIWELCVHTFQYGVQETIQDCTDREKGFYLGDGCYTALTLAVLTKDWSMTQKLIEDSLRSVFVTDSLLTCADCSHIQEIAEFPLILFILVALYLKTTDEKAFIAQHYEALQSVLDTYRKEYEKEPALLSELDKWCVVEWPANYRDGYDAMLTEGAVCEKTHSVINAYYITACKCMNYISETLGHPQYRDTDAMEKIYLDTFFIKDRRVFRDSPESEHTSFPSNMFSYAFGLCPDEPTQAHMLEILSEKTITSANLFVCFPILFKLRLEGKHDLLTRELKRNDAWLRMIEEGATTTFESWGKTCKKNASLFHLTFSFAALFLTDDFWADLT